MLTKLLRLHEALQPDTHDLTKNATLHQSENISQQEYSLDVASYQCSCIASKLLNCKLYSMIPESVGDVASFSVSAVATIIQYSCTGLSRQD